MAIKCAKHPFYSGMRSIRRMGDICPQCQAIRDEVQKSGVKEKRVRNPKGENELVQALKQGVGIEHGRMDGYGNINAQEAPVSVPAAPTAPEVVQMPAVTQAKDEALSGGLGGDEFDITKNNLDEVL